MLCGCSNSLTGFPSGPCLSNFLAPSPFWFLCNHNAARERNRNIALLITASWPVGFNQTLLPHQFCHPQLALPLLVHPLKILPSQIRIKTELEEGWLHSDFLVAPHRSELEQNWRMIGFRFSLKKKNIWWPPVSSRLLFDRSHRHTTVSSEFPERECCP